MHHIIFVDITLVVASNKVWMNCEVWSNDSVFTLSVNYIVLLIIYNCLSYGISIQNEFTGVVYLIAIIIETHTLSFRKCVR